jgi:hypothetical protein
MILNFLEHQGSTTFLFKNSGFDLLLLWSPSARISSAILAYHNQVLHGRRIWYYHVRLIDQYTGMSRPNSIGWRSYQAKWNSVMTALIQSMIFGCSVLESEVQSAVNSFSGLCWSPGLDATAHRSHL